MRRLLEGLSREELIDTQAVKTFINENLMFPKIKEIAFTSAMFEDDFIECEKLCIDAIASETRSYYTLNWLYKLYSVYEKAEKTKEMAETAKKIVFLGNMEYYGNLKSLLIDQGVWDSGYGAFLNECETRMHYTSYMKVLAKENEFSLLLDQLKKHTRAVFEYAELLAKEYPSEILVIFLQQINKEAEAATKRSMYKNVCDSITALAKAGYYADAIALTQDLKKAYSHRPAFADELSQLNAFLRSNPGDSNKTISSVSDKK